MKPPREPRQPIVMQTFSTIVEYAPLRTALAARDWPAFEAGLGALDLPTAALALVDLAEVPDVEQFLEPVVQANPHSAWARTALASTYIRIGWRVRSGLEAKYVSGEQFATFHDWLRRAEEQLAPVFADQPQFAPAWSIGLISGLGLQISKSEEKARYQRVAALSPHDFQAQGIMFQFLLPKWYGSNDEAAAFAQEVADAAPAGSNSAALVAMHHIERCTELWGKPGLAYMKRREVVASLREAANRSVLHPTHRLDPHGVHAHNMFAMAYWLGWQTKDLAVHLRILNGRMNEFPWNYYGVDAARLEEIHLKVLGKA